MHMAGAAIRNKKSNGPYCIYCRSIQRMQNYSGINTSVTWCAMAQKKVPLASLFGAAGAVRSYIQALLFA